MAKTNTESIIELDRVTKTFGSILALNEVSFNVKKGEIFGFLGPNGAGKTTTIRVLLNVLHPNSGEVTVFGEKNTKVNSVHSRLGYLSDDMSLDDDLNAIQYLKFVDHIYGGGNRKRMEELADFFEVNLGQKIRKYSRGNRQKIGLIAAIMHQPELLILDEPTSGFDPIMQEKFLNLVDSFRDQGGTVFISSHDLAEVERICDRVAFIREGEIVGIKSLAGLKDQTTKRVDVYLEKEQAKRLAKSYHSLKGLKLTKSTSNQFSFQFEGDVRKLLRFFAAQDIIDITISEPELEDIFIGYYDTKTDEVNEDD